MAFSGLSCPKCNSNLLESARRCSRCEAPIGKKEWSQAIDNQFIEAFKNVGTMQFIKTRLWFVVMKKVYYLKTLSHKVKALFRRQIVRFT